MSQQMAREKRNETTRVARVMAAITRLIESEALGVGEKLPSIRRAAEEYEVSKNTVIEAYERLAAAGWIVSRPGSGFTVKRRERLPASDRPLHVAEAIDSNVAESDEALPAFLSDDEESTGEEDADEPAVIAAE